MLRYVFPGATVVAVLIGLMVASYRWDNIFLSGRATFLMAKHRDSSTPPAPELPVIQVPARLPPGLDNPSLPEDLPLQGSAASPNIDATKSPAADKPSPPASPAPPGPVVANRAIERSLKAFSTSPPSQHPDGRLTPTKAGPPNGVLEQRQVGTERASGARAPIAPRFAMHPSTPAAPQSPPAPTDSDRNAALSLTLSPPAAPAPPPVASPAARLLSARNQIVAGNSAQARLELEKVETQLAFGSSTNPHVLAEITDCLGALAYGERDAALRHLDQAVSAVGGQPRLTTADESHGERLQP